MALVGLSERRDARKMSMADRVNDCASTHPPPTMTPLATRPIPIPAHASPRPRRSGRDRSCHSAAAPMNGATRLTIGSTESMSEMAASGLHRRGAGGGASTSISGSVRFIGQGPAAGSTTTRRRAGWSWSASRAAAAIAPARC